MALERMAKAAGPGRRLTDGGAHTRPTAAAHREALRADGMRSLHSAPRQKPPRIGESACRRYQAAKRYSRGGPGVGVGFGDGDGVGFGIGMGSGLGLGTGSGFGLGSGKGFGPFTGGSGLSGPGGRGVRPLVGSALAVPCRPFSGSDLSGGAFSALPGSAPGGRGDSPLEPAAASFICAFEGAGIQTARSAHRRPATIERSTDNAERCARAPSAVQRITAIFLSSKGSPSGFLARPRTDFKAPSAGPPSYNAAPPGACRSHR